jgi:repressor LexA
VPDLSEQQRKLFDFIQRYSQSRGYPPSLREMADFLGVRAVSTAYQHVEALRRKGYISKIPNKERGVSSDIMPKTPKLVSIPVLGEIAAGLPIEPVEEPNPVYVSTQLVGNADEHYALKVVGDSMIGDGIQDGDIIIAKAQNYVDRLNQIIVAMTDDGATLKRFGGITKDGLVRLIPRNPKMDIIYSNPETFEVHGIFVGLVRGI